MTKAEQMKNERDFMNRTYSVKSVARGVRYYKKFLMSKIENIFRADGLPETIPFWELLKALIIKGNCVVVKEKGKFFVPFSSSTYWKNSPYTTPNRAVWANPVIGSGDIEDGKTGVIIWASNINKMTGGSVLFETIERYARLLADVESSFANGLYCSRTAMAFMTQNQGLAKDFNQFLEDIEAGNTKAFTNEMMLLDGAKPLSLQLNVSFSEFTQARDYILNCFYNEIGLKTLEEKKERMITVEAENPSDADVIQNNIDILYAGLLKGADDVKKVFDLDWNFYKNEYVLEPEKSDTSENIDFSEIVEQESDEI